MGKRKKDSPKGRKQMKATGESNPVVDGVTWGCDVVSEEPKWILPGAIPANATTLLEGRKAVGKSSLLAAIAAAWTGGPPLPDWQGPTAGRVLWVAAEDSFDNVVIPRLLSAGALVGRIGKLQIKLDSGTLRRPRLPEDLPQVEEVLKACGATLIVLDPFVSLASPGLDLRVEQQARLYLDPLADLCDRLKLTVLLSRHLKKGNHGDAREAGLGSVAIGNAARSILRADEHPHEKDRLVLCTVACNGAKKMTPIIYEIIDGGGGFPRIVWKERVELDIDAIVEGKGSAAERDEWSDADRLLHALIGDHWIPVTTLTREADSAGISPRMLRRAKERLGIPSKRVTFQGDASWQWGPPSRGWPITLQSPAELAGAQGEGGVMGALGQNPLADRAGAKQTRARRPRRPPASVPPPAHDNQSDDESVSED